jgi:meiotically up-regulated gene 157 (Mug157) protein
MIEFPADLAGLLERLELKANADTAERVRSSFVTLFEDAMTLLEDGTIFVSTGDIPAMWIRDSTWQLRPLLAATGQTGESERIIAAVSKRQAKYLLIDPYANAFNIEANSNCWHQDFEDQSPWVFERKFELDSIAAFFDLALRLYRVTGFTDHLDQVFWQAAESCIGLLECESRHEPESYRFVRLGNPAHDQLSHDGFGAPFAHTGLVWSGFRPSDDGCQYPFLIPANAHLAVVLGWLTEAAIEFGRNSLAKRTRQLARALTRAIKKHGIIGQGPDKKYAYEVDGLGNALEWDDPNVPSLLALPYLGWCGFGDKRYLATRSWILSRHNPMYVSGKYATGLASVHTPARHIWPLALAIQGLTAWSHDEVAACLDLMESIDAGTGRNHESVNVDDPTEFTRPWFSWADMTYAHLALRVHALSQRAD